MDDDPLLDGCKLVRCGCLEIETDRNIVFNIPKELMDCIRPANHATLTTVTQTHSAVQCLLRFEDNAICSSLETLLSTDATPLTAFP